MIPDRIGREFETAVECFDRPKDFARGGRALLLPLRIKNLDAGAARRLRSVWPLVLRAEMPIVLDMAGVEFIDTSGLGALRSIEEQSRAVGMALANCSPRLMLILARLPAGRRPPIYPSLSGLIRDVSASEAGIVLLALPSLATTGLALAGSRDHDG